ncbi:hypothetical protein BU14_2680s0001, partial [Porphyra umbilicalis]
MHTRPPTHCTRRDWCASARRTSPRPSTRHVDPLDAPAHSPGGPPTLTPPPGRPPHRSLGLDRPHNRVPAKHLHGHVDKARHRKQAGQLVRPEKPVKRRPRGQPRGRPPPARRVAAPVQKRRRDDPPARHEHPRRLGEPVLHDRPAVEGGARVHRVDRGAAEGEGAHVCADTRKVHGVHDRGWGGPPPPARRGGHRPRCRRPRAGGGLAEHSRRQVNRHEPPDGRRRGEQPRHNAAATRHVHNEPPAARVGDGGAEEPRDGGVGFGGGPRGARHRKVGPPPPLVEVRHEGGLEDALLGRLRQRPHERREEPGRWRVRGGGRRRKGRAALGARGDAGRAADAAAAAHPPRRRRARDG